MAKLFENKVCLVTGAGGAIGRAAALGFAAEGGRVLVTDFDRETGEETVALIAKAGGEAHFTAGDIAVDADVARIVQSAVDRWGGLDCAFNNAGITHPEDAAWDEAVFRKVLDVNLVSQMLCMKYEIPHLLKRGKGSIVNMSSIMGLISSKEPVMHGYTASKHAIVGLTKAAALQYAKQNIRVNALCPGVTRSKIVDATMKMSDAIRDALLNYAPMRGVAEPEEIAECALWLCSDKSSFVTGHALVADGGYTIQ
jgi:NAD(P)-dependent dehydrogenase (short-subunit alcohol dehydrogenase family)